jgi:hypothetical protein
MQIRSIFIAAALLTGCSESTAPGDVTMQSVAGSYAAAPAASGTPTFGALTFTTTATGATANQLARGARVQLVLAPGGTTAGRLVVPGNGAEEGLDADLAGTWTLSGTTVRLQHAADTFLRDMPLTVAGNQLTGDATFSGVRVRLVLQRP